jgi:ribosomal protein S21
MGHQPRLPIDFMLGTQVQDPQKPMDEWVILHQRKLHSAFDQASRKMNQKAAQRKARHDKKVTTEELKPGSRVLLRKRVMGRNKIQDFWSGVPYIVLNKVKDSNAYHVQPVDGVGAIKTSNRVDLLDCGLINDGHLDTHHPDLQSDVVDEDSCNSTSSSDSEMVLEWDDDDLGLMSSFATDTVEASDADPGDVDHSPIEPSSIESSPVEINHAKPRVHGIQDTGVPSSHKARGAIRRSLRKTAGKHSNPHRLPKSVTNNMQVVTFDTFASSIQKLSESLSTTLSATLGNVLKESYLVQKKD